MVNLTPEELAAIQSQDPSLAQQVGQFAGSMGSAAVDFATHSPATPFGLLPYVGAQVVKNAPAFVAGLGQGFSGNPPAPVIPPPQTPENNFVPATAPQPYGPPAPQAGPGGAVPMTDTANLTREQYLAMGINPDLLGSFKKQAAYKQDEGAAIGQGLSEKGQAIKDYQDKSAAEDEAFHNQLAEQPVLLKQRFDELSEATAAQEKARKQIPNRPYGIFDNKTTDEKVGMALVIGLGAILSPVTGFKNQFYNLFRRASDQDLAEQINAYNKAKDISEIRGNRYAQARQYGLDAPQAIQFVKAFDMHNLANKMEEIAARTGSKAIIAQAGQEAEQIRAQGEMMKQNAFNSFVSMNLNNMINSQPSFSQEQLFKNPVLNNNEELKKRLVPMEGRQYRVNTPEDANALKEEFSKIDPSLNALQGLMQITPENFKSMSPYIREHANMLQLFAASGVLATLPGAGKRLNETALKLSKEVISNPTDLFRRDSNTSKHLAEVYNFLQSYKRTQLRARGNPMPAGLASPYAPTTQTMGNLNAP